MFKKLIKKFEGDRKKSPLLKSILKKVSFKETGKQQYRESRSRSKSRVASPYRPMSRRRSDSNSRERGRSPTPYYQKTQPVHKLYYQPFAKIAQDRQFQGRFHGGPK
jgi:hypothetical protein